MKPKPITVKLTQREYEIARFVAVQRNEAGREANADPGKYGNTDMDQFNLHVRGCLGEMAAAKGLNRYWFGAGTGWHDDMDLGVEQVRMTKHLGGRLLIRPEETKLSTIHAPCQGFRWPILSPGTIDAAKTRLGAAGPSGSNCQSTTATVAPAPLACFQALSIREKATRSD